MGRKKYKNSGGRKGRKNLKTLPDGSVRNQHGVVFSLKEKKALDSAVNQANRKRKKQLEEVATMPRKVRGKETGDTVATKLDMGYESDFIIAPKTKSLQRFTSKEQYNKYMKHLKDVNSKDYLNKRTRLYKRNYMEALRRVHGDDAKDIIMKVRMMKPEEFRRLVEQEEFIEINDIYAPEDKASERERIRASLGMKSKEDDAYENYEDDF